MPNFLALFSPVALLLTATASDGTEESAAGPIAAAKQVGGSFAGWMSLEAIEQAAINDQIRIERRLTVRIAPGVPMVNQSALADLPTAELSANMSEKKIGKCLSIAGIAGVQPTRDNRLMLFMRDQRIISASLEKACSARDFYSGFYVERNSDGMLCVDRDKLLSRTGANCEVERLRELVQR